MWGGELVMERTDSVDVVETSGSGKPSIRVIFFGQSGE